MRDVDLLFVCVCVMVRNTGFFRYRCMIGFLTRKIFFILCDNEQQFSCEMSRNVLVMCF